MARTNKTTGPRFVRYLQPVIDALQELGGSGRPAEVKELIIEKYQISDEELNAQIASGASRFGNDVDWARFYLAKAGYIDSSIRGVWSLTEQAEGVNLSHSDAVDLFNKIHRQFAIERAQAGKSTKITKGTEREVEPEVVIEELDHRAALMNILRDLPPEGFERLCQRLLRESGFEKVTVTGRSGDGGLDGIGILMVNPFVTFRVLFQCKRYAGAVNVSQVRDFRGAMMGRTDKGIILTTGTFTSDAKTEAVREGVPPIELVDGEKLLDMFEHLELGLKPRKAYDVDRRFFEEFGGLKK